MTNMFYIYVILATRLTFYTTFSEFKYKRFVSFSILIF